MADAASGAGDEGPCVAGDGSAWSKSLQPALLRSLGATEASVLPAGSPDMIAGDARTAGCRRLVWTGGTTEAAVLRDRLPRSITMVGSDAMRTTAYLSAATGTGADTIATCSCVDVNLSIAPAAQRFVNVYQSSSGLTPGIYAAEGWDLGGILVLLGRTGDSHRDQISAGASGVHRYVGVARTYRFGEAGGVTARSVPPKASMASGSRWVPVDG